MYQVTPDEARTQLNDLIEAALRGETGFITQDAEHKVQSPIGSSYPDQAQPCGGHGQGNIYYAG